MCAILSSYGVTARGCPLRSSISRADCRLCCAFARSRSTRWVCQQRIPLNWISVGTHRRLGQNHSSQATDPCSDCKERMYIENAGDGDCELEYPRGLDRCADLSPGRNRSSGRSPNQEGSSLICLGPHILERTTPVRFQVKQRPRLLVPRRDPCVFIFNLDTASSTPAERDEP